MAPMSSGDLLRTYATVFVAELPDKTMVATVVLVARVRRPLWVWSGAVAAFTLHVTVAVLAGSALALLPESVVGAAVATMFAVGSVLLWRTARHNAGRVDETEASTPSTARAAVLGSFGLIALAEWGDLTQLATAGLAASSGAPVATWIGAIAALASVAGIAALFGRQLVSRVPIHRINYIGATVFAALAVWTLVDLLR